MTEQQRSNILCWWSRIGGKQKGWVSLLRLQCKSYECNKMYYNLDASYLTLYFGISVILSNQKALDTVYSPCFTCTKYDSAPLQSVWNANTRPKPQNSGQLNLDYRILLHAVHCLSCGCSKRGYVGHLRFRLHSRNVYLRFSRSHIFILSVLVFLNSVRVTTVSCSGLGGATWCGSVIWSEHSQLLLCCSTSTGCCLRPGTKKQVSTHK